MPDETSKTYGVFISHASEDKTEVARPLAQELERLGVKVWLDEFELTLGDSLRQEIDRGLTQSRFGVVILSPNFFRKEWTVRELDALVAIEGDGKVILPVWHHLTKEQIIQYSPLVAGKLAVSTDKGVQFVANEIFRAIKRANGEPSIVESPEDYRAKRLADICNVLPTKTHSKPFRKLTTDFQQAKEDIDKFLSDYPKDNQGMIVKEEIHTKWYTEILVRSRNAPSYYGLQMLDLGLDRFLLSYPNDIEGTLLKKRILEELEAYKRAIQDKEKAQKKAIRLAEIRQRLLVAWTRDELIALRSEIEKFLIEYPSDNEGEVLREDIEKIRRREKIQTKQETTKYYNSTPKPSIERRSLPVNYSTLFIGCGLTLVILLAIIIIILQNWK